MDRFDGTAARQLDLVDEQNAPIARRDAAGRRGPMLRMLRKNIYAELARRRRRAQISARKWLT